MCTHTTKWLKYQELLVHVVGFFCTCEYANVPFWAKKVHVSGIFIYPAVHLSGVPSVCVCIYIYIYI